EEHLEAIVSENGLERKVVFLPPVSMDDLVPAAVGAGLGLVLYMPTNKNNFTAAPNKLFEYMCSGVPSIGSDLPYIRRTIRELGIGEVFSPVDSKDLARVICRLLEDEDSLQIMKKRC